MSEEVKNHFTVERIDLDEIPLKKIKRACKLQIKIHSDYYPPFYLYSNASTLIECEIIYDMKKKMEGHKPVWVATQIGISSSTLYAILRGRKPRTETLVKIAKWLSVEKTRNEWIANYDPEL